MTSTVPSTDRPTETQNKDTVRGFFDAFAAGDDAGLDALMTPDFVAHSLPPGLTPDAAGLRQMAATVHAGLRDCRVEIHDLVAEGDRVVARFSTHAVHGGELFGIAPSGRPVSMTGIEWYRLEAGRVAEFWGEYDTSDMPG